MLNGMEKIARVTLSDTAAGMLNSGRVNAAKLTDMAKKAAGAKMSELMESARVLVFRNGERTMAFGMGEGYSGVVEKLAAAGQLPEDADIGDPASGISDVSVAEIVNGRVLLGA